MVERTPPPPPEPSVDAFKQHFRSMFNRRSGAAEDKQAEEVETKPEEANDQAEVAESLGINYTNVSTAIAKMQPNKSSGNCRFQIDVLKGHKKPHAHEATCTLFCIAASKGIPRKWRDTLLMPIYKRKGERSACVNYRPVSLIHPMGKAYAHVILGALYRIQQERMMHAECQGGFRPGHRLEDNAIILQTVVESLKLHNSAGYACFVDLSKAYDSVNRMQLFEVMVGELGIDPAIV